MHKFVMKPSETGELVVEMDTSRFAGKKIVRLFLTTIRVAFTIAGISDHSP
jgi:hypothetical protein